MSPTDDALDKEDAGFEAYSALRGTLEQAEKIIGEAGRPLGLMIFVDLQAKGSTEAANVVELYVLGNMPAETVEAVLPVAIRRYLAELGRPAEAQNADG